MSSYDIYAKSNGTTLKEHSEDVLKVLEVILENDEKLLKNKFNKNFNDFKSNLLKTVLFHDFGKSYDEWQEKLIAIMNGEKTKTPPHSFFSGYYLNPMDKSNNLYPLLAVLSHHSLMTNNSFKNISIDVSLNEEYVNEIAKSRKIKLSKFPNLGEYKNYLLETIKQTNIMQYRSLYENTFINLSFKRDYCYYLSYLTLCDNLASSFEEDAIKITKNRIRQKNPSCEELYNLLENIDEKYSLTSIQNQIIEINKEDLIYSILMEAPCGEGKTLASLLFARNLFKNNIINKVIFTLPTQTTSNSMYKEFNETYKIPSEYTGIYHSEVLNFLLNEKESSQDALYEKFLNVTYSKPFNVSTIDHLLLSLVNGYKYAPRSFGNLQNSLVVIDELHYYEDYTLSLIEVLCEVLRFLKIPHIIMSATIPKYIKEKFNDNEYLKIQSTGHDFNNIEKNPFKFQYHENSIIDKNGILDESARLIIENNIDKNIGIIVNTIDKSQILFEQLRKLFPEKQFLLYNARFMKKDRPIKENILRIFSKSMMKEVSEEELNLIKNYGFDIKKNIIFIGTQVAEISLNVSFDLILSDLAPLDSLIQRGGRLHRKQSFDNSLNCDCVQCSNFNSKHLYIFHVFDTGEECIPYYSKEDNENSTYKKNIIENTRNELKKSQKFTFMNSISMMDNVYDKNSFSKENEKVKIEYKEKIKEDLIFGGKTYDENKGKGLRIETRDFKYSTINVIPSIITYNNEEIYSLDFIKKVYNEYTYDNELNFKGINLISDYLINVPFRYYEKNKNQVCHIGKYRIHIINDSYSFERGLFNDYETIL